MGGPVASSTYLLFRVADYIQSPFASGLYLQRGITTCGYIGSTLTFDMIYPHTGGSTTGRTYRLAEFTYSRLSLSPKPRLPSLAHPPRMISGVFSSHSHLAFCGTRVLFDRLSSWASDVSPVDFDSSTFAAVALLHGVVSTHSSGPSSITLQRGVHSSYTVRDGYTWSFRLHPASHLCLQQFVQHLSLRGGVRVYISRCSHGFSCMLVRLVCIRLVCILGWPPTHAFVTQTHMHLAGRPVSGRRSFLGTVHRMLTCGIHLSTSPPLGTIYRPGGGGSLRTCVGLVSSYESQWGGDSPPSIRCFLSLSLSPTHASASRAL